MKNTHKPAPQIPYDEEIPMQVFQLLSLLLNLEKSKEENHLGKKV